MDQSSEVGLGALENSLIGGLEKLQRVKRRSFEVEIHHEHLAPPPNQLGSDVRQGPGAFDTAPVRVEGDRVHVTPPPPVIRPSSASRQLARTARSSAPTP